MHWESKRILEVAIILVSIGVACKAWIEIALGGVLAFASTLGVAILLHGKSKSVPNVLIKLGTGIMLFVPSIFWVLESFR